MRVLDAAIDGRDRRPEPASGLLALLAFILFCGPLAWFGQMTLAFMLTGRACYPYYLPVMLPMAGWTPVAIHLASALALVVNLAALYASWLLKRTIEGQAGAGHRHPSRFGESRTRFLADVGIIVNSLFAVACVFTFAAYLLVPLCA